MSEFQILVVSGPDRDGLTAELWQDNTLVAELFEDSGELRLQLHTSRGNPWWEFSYAEFQQALTAMRGRLLGEPSV